MKRVLLFVSVVALALVAYGDDGGRRFSTPMTGAEEVPGPGDPDGQGFVSLELNPGQEQICFHILVSNITLPATGAHIHEAASGVAGPVVVPLTPPGADGISSGCVGPEAGADREEILEIIQEPEEYYVNVHNSDFPAGAVRGQLEK
jgi:hypothetical protein